MPNLSGIQESKTDYFLGYCLIICIPFLSLKRSLSLFAVSEVVKFAFRWACLVWRQRGVVAVKR